MKVAVLGAGSWGTALASVVAWNGHDAVLWARDKVVVEQIQNEHINIKYLKHAQLPLSLTATMKIEDAVRDANLVIFAIASAAMDSVVQKVKAFLPPDAYLAHAVKGFDVPSKRRMSQILLDEIPDALARLSVISGPSHAEEVVQKRPTTLVVAAYSRQTAESVQDVLMNSAFRVYTNPDVVGTELGGTLKNIIALGVGIADGLGFGDNAKAALMTRGLAEITRLGVAMGASPLTFAGLSGVGDLIVTCTSQHSRNFKAGRLLGQGYTPEAAVQEIGMVVEGIRTTQATLDIASDYRVEMPITEAIYEVLFQHKAPLDAVEQLMGRAPNHEIEDVANQDMSQKWQMR